MPHETFGWPHALTPHTRLRFFLQTKRLGGESSGAVAVQQHEFFKPINWRKLERREVRGARNAHWVSALLAVACA